MKAKLFHSSGAVRTVVLAGLIIISGCAVGPNYQRHATPSPTQFDHAAEVSATSNAVMTAWWRSFKDPTLERLVALASTNNYSLQLAQARLHEARALWTAARFDFGPTIRSENRYQKSQLSEDVAKGSSRQTELYRVGFDATWELDLWGRVRRNVEAARATVESVEATRDDVLISVQAEVAANYMDLRGNQAQLDVARRNATNQAQTLKLAVDLRDGGQGTQLDVARARSQLYETLAFVPPLEASVQRAAHRIAVLCGQPPETLRTELTQAAPVPVPPPELTLDSPADLLRRRPDVRAAERALAAATAHIGVEVADLFPSVTFVGTIGLQASSFSALTTSGADTYGFGPHISWAAFDLGRVRQRIKAADAKAEGALAVYQQTVLLALEETENSLVTLSRERQRLASLTEAERAAVEATELARQRYRDGIADFLSVLDAERTLLSLQEQLVTSQTRSLTSLVALYKAFAGGLPAKEQIPPGK